MLQTPVGLVQKIKPKIIKGWFIDPRGTPNPTVTILLNGRKVAHTTACAPVEFNGGVREVGWARRLCQLWNYLGPQDELQVECMGVILPIVDHGTSYIHKGATSSRAAELFELLEQGYVFNKYGILNLSIQRDQAWQKGITELFWELQRKLKDRFGVDLQVTYGTMLGAIREKNFIGHDNDFDTCYTSSHRTPKTVRAEFIRICRFLIDEGYQVLVKKTHTWVMIPGTEFKMDIFYSWFHENNEYEASYGYHGPALKWKPELFQMREVQLGNFTVSAPVAAEDMLAHFYGTEWRIPDPGFTHFGPTRKQTESYLLLPWQLSRLHWRQYYRDHKEPEEPSSFARFVAPQLQPKTLILECGCGNGRDSLYFAEQGFEVLASDRSKAAVLNARRALEGRTLPGHCSFKVVDVGLVDELRQFFSHGRIGLVHAKGRDVVVYARFLLHNIPTRHEKRFFRAIKELLPPGTRIFVEFKTNADRSKVVEKAYRNQYRRFLSAARFKRRVVREHGFEIISHEVAYGLSPYNGTNPQLFRGVLRIPVPAASVAATPAPQAVATPTQQPAPRVGLRQKLRGLLAR